MLRRHRRRDRLARHLANPCHAVVEQLEGRRLLTGTTFNWVGGPGSWNNPASWSHDPPQGEPDRNLPNGEDTVNIGPEAGLVTIPAAIFAAAKILNLAADARMETGANLNIFAKNGGNLNINGEDTTLTMVGGGNTRIIFNNNTSPNQVQVTYNIGGNGELRFESGGGLILTNGFGAVNDRLIIGASTTIRSTASSSSTVSAPVIINFGTMLSDAPGGTGLNISGNTTGASHFFTNRGLVRTSNGGAVQIGTAVEKKWVNSGRIEIDGGNLRLGGTFRQSDLGEYTRIGGAIDIMNSAKFTGNLVLDDHSGSWRMNGGVLEGSRITRTGNQTFTFNSSGVWDHCTLTFDVTVVGFQSAQIRNGLTLENNAALRFDSGGTLRVQGSQSIEGEGQILFGGTSGGRIDILAPAPHTLTIGEGVVVRTDVNGGSILGQATDRVVIDGQVAVTNGMSMSINPICDVSGQLTVDSGATLSVTSTLNILPGGGMSIGPTSTLLSAKDITIATTKAAQTRPIGTFNLTGGGGAGPFQLIEAMSQDRGANTSGYRDNFAMGRLLLNGAPRIRLVDSADNAAGADAEAMYVDSLVVPTGSTLDLNGLKLFARIASVQGTITGGTVTMLSDGGPMLFSLPTSGRIETAGQQDNWTFFGRAGQTISAVMNPGNFSSPGSPNTIAPHLGTGRMTLLAPDGSVVGTTQGTGQLAFTLADQVLPVDGTYTLRAQSALTAPNNTGHYNLTIYDVSVETRPYLLNTIASGNIETPFVKDRWTFSLHAGQQIQFDLLAATTSGLQFTLDGPDGFIAFNNITNDSALITIPGGRGGNYALTAKGATDQTGAYSFTVRDGSITPLTLGVPFAGTLVGSGSPTWFKVNLPNPGQLLVTLDDATNTDRNQVFLRRGQLPTQSEYDHRLVAPAADGTIYVPNASPGDWYILLYADNVPAPSNYTLKAELRELRISTITPDRYGIDNTMTMTLTGGGFEPGTSVKLTSGSTTINASSVTIDSFTQVTATFNLAGAPQATFDVQVQRGPASFTLPAGFKTLPNTPAKLDMKLNMPGNATRTTTTSFTVEYANTGNVAMPAPLIIVQSADPDGDEHPVLSLDASRILETFWSTTIPQGTSERVMMLGSGAVPGMLNPGERIKVPIQYLGEKSPVSDQDQTLQLEVRCVETGGAAHGTRHDDDTIDWAALKEPLRPPTVSQAVWDQVFANITGSLTTVEAYADLLRDNATYLGRLGMRLLDLDDLWNFEVVKALGAISAFPTLASAVDLNVPAPGVSLSFTRRFADGVIGRNVDGPLGFGWAVPWFATLSISANDDVLIIHNSGGGQRRFTRDGRGTGRNYFSDVGDTSSMKRVSAGIFQLVDEGGTITRFRADGKIDFVQDSNANRVTAGYNGAGRLISLTHTSGASMTISYNGNGRISSISDSLGHSVTYDYDASGDHLTSAVADDGTTSTYSYVTTTSNVLRTHALTSDTSAGSSRNFTYDSLGRVSTTSAAGGTQTLNVAYNSGRITLSDSTGSAQLFFDHQARLGKVTNARGFSTTTKYDDDNRPSSITMPDGSMQQYEWCDCGSLTKLTDELGQVSKFTYDRAIDRLTSITDAKGNVTRMTYDSAGNALQMIHADGSVESVSNHSAIGLPQTRTNRRGQAVTYTYNAAGQILTRTVNGQTAQYAYDARGRIASINSGGITTFTYDTAIDGDRLKRITYPGGKFIEYDFDNDGRRTAMRDQSGFTTRYEYDAAGRLLHIRDTGNNALESYTYDSPGRLTRIDKGNGTFTTYGYDAAGNILSIQNFRSVGVPNSSFTYTYDSRDRGITATTPDGAWTYGYDAAGQLISATFVSTNAQITNQNIQITYDPAGNREFINHNGDLIDYGTNVLNQYTSVDGVAYSYDADGNLIFDGEREYTYNEMNQLTQVSDGTEVEQYSYNALNRRTGKITNGVQTNYLVTPDLFGLVFAEYNGGGTQTARNVIGAGMLGRIDGAAGAVNYYDFDLTGSVIGMSSAGGTYVNRYAYDPSGLKLLSSEAIANPYQYVGEFGVRAESNGLSHMGFRDYSGALGRFLTIDPLRQRADVNTYRYASNSPIMNIDPLGLAPFNKFTELVITTGHSAGVNAGGNKIAGEDISLDGVLTGFALDAGFGFKGAAMWANAVQVSMKPEVFGNIIQGVCGIKRQRDFGTINLSAAKQLAALTGSKGAGGASVDEGCNEPGHKSGDANMNLGDRCGYGEAALRHAVDPNEKTPPVGVGPDNRVPGDQPIAYTIDFENIGPGSVDDNGDPFPVVATAPVQRITITDQLSASFDFSTVQFTEFAFADTFVPVTDGFGDVHTTVPIFSGGESFIVQIDAETDVVTGMVIVVMQAMDPITGLPPSSGLGLLQPEDGSGNGMGHVKFSATPIESIADGTQIRNIARIRFDGNDVIPTNQINPLDPTQGTSPDREALVTIDAAGPSVVGSPVFVFDAPSPRITIQFNEDVSASLSIASIVIDDLTHGGTIDPVGFSYNTKTNTATWDLGAALPRANYHLVLPAANVADAAGNHLAGDVTFDFFHLPGDADHNGVVNFDDYARIDLGFNTDLHGFANGDFNYDGQINFDDYAIIDNAFNTQ